MQEKETIIGALEQSPRELTTAETEKYSADALFDSSDEYVSVGGVRVQIKWLFWEDEIKMLRALAPYQKMLIDAAAIGALDETIGALLVEATYDLERLAVMVLRGQMEKLGIPPVDTTKNTPTGLADLLPEEIEEARLQAIRQWLRTRARFAEIAELVLAQIKRNKLGESLGKLWAPGVLHIKALQILNTLQSRDMQG
jgi:hypothetical protein